MPGKRSGGGQQQSVVTVFQEMLQLLTEAKLMPDAQAHMQVIQALEQGIIKYIQTVRTQQIGQAVRGPQQDQQSAQGGMPGMQAGGGMGPQSPGGPMPPRQIQPGGGAGMSGFGTPNPDELRRTLAGPASVGVG
jgi:hypothetical protein